MLKKISTVARVKLFYVACSKNGFLPWTMENDQRQLLAQFRSTSNSDISSGALLVVLQDICFPLRQLPHSTHFFQKAKKTPEVKCITKARLSLPPEIAAAVGASLQTPAAAEDSRKAAALRANTSQVDSRWLDMNTQSRKEPTHRSKTKHVTSITDIFIAAVFFS